MANIVTLPRSPNTGLSTLGQVILGGTADYAQKRRQDEREALLREQRLADVESDRAYARTEGNRLYERDQTTRSKNLTEARAYAEGLAERQVRQALVTHVAQTYGLTPQDLSDPAKLAAAFERARVDGIFARMPGVKEAVAAGDLSADELGNPNAIEAGLYRFSLRLAERTEQDEEGRKRAAERANELAGEEQELASTMAQLERRLNEPTPVPSRWEVRARAVERAKAGKKLNYVPPEAEITALEPTIAKEMQMEAMAAAYEDKEDAKVQAQIVARRLGDLRAEKNTLTNIFRAVGVSGTPKPRAEANIQQGRAPNVQRPTTASATPAPGGQPKMTPEQFAASMVKRPPPPVAMPAPNGSSATPSAVARLEPPAPAYTPAPTRPGMESTRANEAVGDKMRAFGQGVSNVFRPSSWVGNMQETLGRPAMPLSNPAASVLTFEVAPEVQLRQLESRLSALADQQSPTAAAIRNQILSLQRSLAQMMTRRGNANLAEPMSTAMDTTPRRMMDSRLFEPSL